MFIVIFLLRIEFIHKIHYLCLSIEFSRIEKNVTDKIARKDKVLVAGIDGEEPKRQYEVTVRLVNGSMKNLK